MLCSNCVSFFLLNVMFRVSSLIRSHLFVSLNVVFFFYLYFRFVHVKGKSCLNYLCSKIFSRLNIVIVVLLLFYFYFS